MDREHERRVSQLAALFGSDTNGHLRTNRNLTELWSQFDSRRRGALDQSEFTACLEFMASRSSAAASNHCSPQVSNKNECTQQEHQNIQAALKQCSPRGLASLRAPPRASKALGY